MGRLVCEYCKKGSKDVIGFCFLFFYKKTFALLGFCLNCDKMLMCLGKIEVFFKVALSTTIIYLPLLMAKACVTVYKAFFSAKT